MDRYTENEGFYGSVDLLSDTLGPLLPLSAFEGKCVAEIGSGTGRIVRMLLAAGAGKVLAIERSQVVVLGIAVSPSVYISGAARTIAFASAHGLSCNLTILQACLVTLSGVIRSLPPSHD